MAEFIYTMVRARKAVGEKLILDDVTMSFFPGAKIGMVGPNGAGKSTILKIMAGLDTPSNGDAALTPGYTVGILMQEPVLDETKNVLENVRDGVREIHGKIQRFNEISVAMSDPEADFDSPLSEMGTLQEAIDAADAWDLDSQLEQAMDALRCPPSDAEISHLSGGEKRRVALCKLLLEKPDLLLLDEPTNHLDAESVLWLEQHLSKYPGAVIAVTHDRYFLDHVAEWIAEVDRGRLYPYEGNYSTYLEKKGERLQVQGKKDQKLAKRLADELEWVRSNAKDAKQSRRRDLLAMKKWQKRPIGPRSLTLKRFKSRRDQGLVSKSLKPGRLKRVLAIAFSSTISAFPSHETGSSASLAPTVWESPHYSSPLSGLNPLTTEN